MPNKVFLEISNVCNMSCSFCHGTKREKRFMSVDEFTRAATQARDFGDYLYFHLLGEPLLHPELERFFEIAHELGFKVIITTNGTLLRKIESVLLNAKSLFKVSISLHSFESEGGMYTMDEYLNSCFDFCRRASDAGIVSVLRLWNLGVEDTFNEEIIAKMRSYFSEEGVLWRKIFSGYKIKDKVFLEWGQRFDWPDTEAEFCSDSHFCYGLINQIGILSDGSVVPCCLDADGAVTLGNVFTTELKEILASPRAKALRASFEKRKVTERLCQRCGYAKMKGYRT